MSREKTFTGLVSEEVSSDQLINGSQLINGNQLINSCIRGGRWRFYCKSSSLMEECLDNSIALTITSPPYWNSIDYDTHTKGTDGEVEDYRARQYAHFGKSYTDYLDRLEEVFSEVSRVTICGGFCAIVIGTILYKGEHYAVPFDLVPRLASRGWIFHQDIIWNKVTGGVKRAGSFIQRPRAGYYYPNIMTEYILVFRKSGKRRYGRHDSLVIDDLFKRDIANNIWHIAPVPPRSIRHPCAYPEELVRRLVLLYSQKDDEILDPFLGSGQTAKVALRHGRSVVGYDIEAEYLKLASSRLHESSPRKFNLVPEFQRIESREY